GGSRRHLRAGRGRVALTAHAMRNILVDRARAAQRDKRRHAKVELNSRIEGEQPVDLIELNTALIRLAAIDGELASLVEMRYFGGLTLAEAGVAMGVSEVTAKRRWVVARAWLADALANSLGDD
ncbi:MAG: ECF-type sigma factor, partial [Novosphingobium sp.]